MHAALRDDRFVPPGGPADSVLVDDLAATYAYCRAQGCTITAEPVDADYRDRVFECIDPFGYLWEMSQPVVSVPKEEALRHLGADWSERSSD